MINNTIADLKKARNDIRDAIINKGGSLTHTSQFDTYPDAIRAIESGGTEIKFPNSFLYLLKEGDPDLTNGIYTGPETKIYVDESIFGIAYSKLFMGSIVESVMYINKNIYNMAQMFRNSQATTLDLSNFDTSMVTSMTQMFHNSQATTLDLSSFDTSQVTDMSSMFNSSQATTLDLSSFDTSMVTDMIQMFHNSQATTLDLSNFDTSMVTDMYSMFNYSQATTLDLSSFDTSQVTDMGSMFNDSKATTLDLSSFDTSKVTNMYSMFRNSMVKTVYCRTEDDRTKFMSSSNLPTGINFIVGKP